MKKRSSNTRLKKLLAELLLKTEVTREVLRKNGKAISEAVLGPGTQVQRSDRTKLMAKISGRFHRDVYVYDTTRIS